MNKKTGKVWYLPQLDIIRCWAFLSVFVCHVINMSGRQGPHNVFATISEACGFGVDMFFTLSSYLITTLLVREIKNSGSVNIWSFYKRRILRIWPLYYGFLGLYLLFGEKLSGETMTGRTLLFFSLLSGNWAMFLGLKTAVIFPLWSVSVEEQFYAFWAPVVKRLSLKALPWAAAMLWAISLTMRFILSFSPLPVFEATWFNTFARLDPIAVGILVATVFSGYTVKYGKTVIVLSAAALFASKFLWSTGNPAVDSRILSYLVPAVCCGVILQSTVNMQNLGGGWLNEMLQYLGKISYGLYIFHVPSLMVVHLFLPGHGIIVGMVHVILSLGIDIGISALSYTFYESWFLRRKNRPLLDFQKARTTETILFTQ